MERKKALAEFRRLMVVLTLVAAAMVVGALFYLSRDADLTLHEIVATVLGVFISVVLGSGLFAAAFFSAKSGHDQQVADSTSRDGSINKDKESGRGS